ncbi:MAG: SulP family inorganic anion transporter [Myxococcota bacterium]
MMKYDPAHLKGDLAGGFVAGVIALPLALAFGVQSGLGAAAGLYGAIAVGIFAAALGGTPTQASGPTGPMTVVSAAVVAYAIDQTGSISTGLGIALLSFFVGGALQCALGFARVGKYVKYFPYPVVSGFMSGVGIIIIALQIWPFLGSSSPKSTVDVFLRLGEPLSQINPSAVGLGTLTLVTFYLFPLVTKKVPAVLVALIVGTVASVALGLDVPRIGDIPSGLPELRITEMFSVGSEHYRFILESGVTLALLGSIDSLLTSVIADNLTKTTHDSNRELFGQGVANMVAAMVGGIPGAGATKGTVVNINAGGRTRLSGVFHGLIQLAVLLGLGSIAALIPLSVLAGLLISVGVAILDKRGFRHFRRVPKADSFVMVIVLLWTVFGNLIAAVAVGFTLTSILFMKKTGDRAEARGKVGELKDEPPWADESAGQDVADLAHGVFVKHLDGPLFFGSTAGFRGLVASLPADVRALIIRMDRVPYMDQSGLYALEDALLDLCQRGTRVVLVGLQEQPEARLRGINLVPDLIGEANVVSTFAEALSRAQATGDTPAPTGGGRDRAAA